MRLAVLLVSALISLLLIGSARDAFSGENFARAKQVVAVGQAIYVKQCARCHGDDLQGQPNFRQRLPNGKMPAPAHDETGHTWHHPDWQLFEITKTARQPFRPSEYKTDMPAYKDILTDEEIWAVLAFIKNSWPVNIQERQSEISRTMLR
jgi:mono/diheme cytochrome c family protein